MQASGEQGSATKMVQVSLTTVLSTSTPGSLQIVARRIRISEQSLPLCNLLCHLHKLGSNTVWLYRRLVCSIAHLLAQGLRGCK